MVIHDMVQGRQKLYLGKLYFGATLFAASLAWLAAVTPALVAIACVLGGGAGLILFSQTRSRFALGIMTLLMLAVSGCTLFAVLMLGEVALVPVAVAQIAAILLLEPRTNGVQMIDPTKAKPVRARELAHR